MQTENPVMVSNSLYVEMQENHLKYIKTLNEKLAKQQEEINDLKQLLTIARLDAVFDRFADSIAAAMTKENVTALTKFKEAINYTLANDLDTLICEEYLPYNQLWNFIDADVKSIKWVVFPSVGEWRVQPTPWSVCLDKKLHGLGTNTLIELTGISDALFVRFDGSVGAAMTKESAIALTKFN